MYKGLHIKHANELTFINRFSKNIQISNFMKIRRVETELFHADGETDGQT
jgi:hypothetical protein